MLNSVCKPYKELEDVMQTFEEQLELFFLKEFETKSNNPKQDENLGQVFTSAILANL